jgi:hypothetical protein
MVVVVVPELVVTLLVPVPVVVPIVGVLVLPGPVFECEDTDPTISAPVVSPWSALFGAPRLFGAREWICKGVLVAVVADDPVDVV